MYNERKSSFTFMDVIFNLLFIALFVFILIWLFPTKSFLNDALNRLDGQASSLNALTEQIFNQNVNTMKEAAISYFTTPRLPKKVGESVTLTLKEMRDKNLILPLTDKHGNTCDEGVSYVKLTKTDDEYVLKVLLGCSDKEDYILVHLGCYDYCEGAVCEKEKPEEKTYTYQYMLATSCTWSNWSNWSDWTTTYTASNNYKKVETKVATEATNVTVYNTYTCPNGYKLNESDKKCYKNVSTTDKKTVIETPSYTCPNGYKLEGTKCKMDVTTSEVVSATATTEYKCPADYEKDGIKYTYKLDGNKCILTYLVDASKKDEYSCESGTLNGDKCTITESSKATATTTYSCAKGTLSGNKCVVNEVVDAEKYEESKTCPSGYSPNGSNCVKVTTKVVPGETTTVCSTTNVLDCSSGTCKTVPKRTCTTKQGYNREVKDYSYASYNIKYGYKCSQGTYDGGTKCNVSTTTDATPSTTYSCASGTLNGDKCTSSKTVAATKNTTYSCPANTSTRTYKLNGDKCDVTDTVNATSNTVYTCPDNTYKLDTNKCTKSVVKSDIKEATKNISYSCETGYTLSDNVCMKTTNDTLVENAKVNSNYACPNGYLLDGNRCIKKITYYRYSTRSCNGGSVDYKWSNSNNDQSLLNSGYKLTGVKQEVTLK